MKKIETKLLFFLILVVPLIAVAACIKNTSRSSRTIAVYISCLDRSSDFPTCLLNRKKKEIRKKVTVLDRTNYRTFTLFTNDTGLCVGG